MHRVRAAGHEPLDAMQASFRRAASLCKGTHGPAGFRPETGIGGKPLAFKRHRPIV
jgi:hypothetical protein